MTEPSGSEGAGASRQARAEARRCAHGTCECRAAAEYGVYCGEHCAEAERRELIPQPCDCGHVDCKERQSAAR